MVDLKEILNRFKSQPDPVVQPIPKQGYLAFDPAQSPNTPLIPEHSIHGQGLKNPDRLPRAEESQISDKKWQGDILSAKGAEADKDRKEQLERYVAWVDEHGVDPAGSHQPVLGSKYGKSRSL